MPYSPEFSDIAPNEELLQTLASLTPRGGKPGVEIQDDATAAPSSDDLPKLDAVGATVQKWLDFNTFRHDLPESSRTTPAWHLAAWAAALLFLADVFVRRVRLNLAWMPPLAMAAMRKVLRRKPVPEASLVMARLRNSKAQVAESLEKQRAAARFEAAADAPESDPAIERLFDRQATTNSDKPAASPLADDAPCEEETYTGRLLKAKRKIHDERERNRPIPDSPKDSPPSGPNG